MVPMVSLLQRFHYTFMSLFSISRDDYIGLILIVFMCSYSLKLLIKLKVITVYACWILL